MCVTTEPNDLSPPSDPQAMDGYQEALLLLLEHAASDDLLSFTKTTADFNLPLDSTSRWYARWWPAHDRLRRSHYETRSPLMVAALHGSVNVVQHLLSADPTSANRRCGSDSATPLHCAAAGGSPSSPQVIRLLLSAGADLSLPDASGRIPADVIPRHSRSGPAVEALLRGGSFPPEETRRVTVEKKKEYPVDATLPDIKSGVYGTDEFRMYSFKVKPCSRAYSHDWTECPFVHPGENARRRDPRKYHYSCVPCPDFRKGSCRSGDACEYAHGVFESWLHPAQYRTRLCKDETGCTRRVCFFAHKNEELRPLYPSSPSSTSLVSSPRASNLPPLDLGTAAMLLQQPLPQSAPSAALAAWLNATAAMPTSPLPSSRLKAGVAARDVDLDLELMAFDGYKQQHQQQKNLMDEIGSIPITPTPSGWSNPHQIPRGAGEEMFGSMDSSSPLHSPRKGLSMNTTGSSFHHHHHQQQLLYGGGNLPSSPSARSSSSSLATALMNGRASAFAKQRSQSFVDRGSTRLASLSVPSIPAAAAFSDWGSPDGKLDWAIQGEELSKLRKSASFAFRGSGVAANSNAPATEEPDVSWVQSLVKDGPSTAAAEVDSRRQQCPHLNESGGGDEDEKFSVWAEQLYLEKEQLVA